MKRLRRNEFTPQLTGFKSHSDLDHGTYMRSGSTKYLAEKDLLIQELGIPSESIKIQEKIGEGAFGIVLKATLTTDEGPKDVALKGVKGTADDSETSSILFDELKLMRKIGSHPNVISLI
ncbi:hypothetical protein QZH41_017907, partial [Actinostola sp. cb2023]